MVNQTRSNKFMEHLVEDSEPASKNNNGRIVQDIPSSKGVRIYAGPRINSEQAKTNPTTETFLRDARNKGGQKSLAERMRSSQSVRAKLIAKSKLKKIRDSESAPEEDDSVQALIRDEDFNEGKRSAKVIRAELYAKHKLKKILDKADPEKNQNTQEKKSDSRQLNVHQHPWVKDSHQTCQKKELDTYDYDSRETTEGENVYDADFKDHSTFATRNKATKMMLFLELGRRLSREFDLNKTMKFQSNSLVPPDASQEAW
eukprot:CAMPEP_0194265442 /NCGR_PEP_ID=MMETSP0169-20130528/688_1 /TAXON_ID=218684 /ORGANISM="Corethron pennatum, Strain L29A3" /LENGTH=257 /DNA_ID=CAMNT_0039005909 /DNA_START=234 /DNA_END=1004 /DNA_ORIENTATION=-